MANTLIHILNTLVNRADTVLNDIRKSYLKPSGQKRPRTFSVTETAELVGRSTESIRAAEKSGKVPGPGMNDETGRRIGYTLFEINRLRKHFGTLPWRKEEDETCILAVQNFKGGVGKSITASHLAQFLALKGYRVLLIDADSQASSTAAFGYIPDADINRADTLYPMLAGEQPDIRYAIRNTHWDGLDLVPSCLQLFGAEYVLAGLQGQATADKSVYHFFEQLSLGIEPVKQDYDIILIDSPPALGMISLCIIYAATSLLIPLPPALLDFASTRQFFAGLVETLSVIAEKVGEKELSFFRILLSRYDITSDSQTSFAEMIKATFGKYLTQSSLLKTDEILNASAFFSTVYDLESHLGSRKTYKRALSILDKVCNEVEQLILQTWPSHVKKMREQGIIVGE